LLQPASRRVIQKGVRRCSPSLCCPFCRSRCWRPLSLDPVTSGVVRCTLRAGTRIVAARASGFARRAAACKWTVPRSAKGKRLTGAVAVTYKVATVKKTLTLRAR
jgi:hypothetical protein